MPVGLRPLGTLSVASFGLLDSKDGDRCRRDRVRVSDNSGLTVAVLSWRAK